MSPCDTGEIPPLRPDAGELWRAQAIPAEIRRHLRGLPLPDAEPGREERGRLRFALLALAAILLLILVGAEPEEPAGGRRLELRSGRVHLVWVRINASEASK
ncbi:MAG: hypothetical protein WC326_05420 [Candidatus Delongbacteria bacterium]